jgi:tartrate dehydratase alpha subunit/fumarate hydratase class I-like protein
LIFKFKTLLQKCIVATQRDFIVVACGPIWPAITITVVADTANIISPETAVIDDIDINNPSLLFYHN